MTLKKLQMRRSETGTISGKLGLPLRFPLDLEPAGDVAVRRIVVVAVSEHTGFLTLRTNIVGS